MELFVCLPHRAINSIREGVVSVLFTIVSPTSSVFSDSKYLWNEIINEYIMCFNYHKNPVIYYFSLGGF